MISEPSVSSVSNRSLVALRYLMHLHSLFLSSLSGSFTCVVKNATAVWIPGLACLQRNKSWATTWWKNSDLVLFIFCSLCLYQIGMTLPELLFCHQTIWVGCQELLIDIFAYQLSLYRFWNNLIAYQGTHVYGRVLWWVWSVYHTLHINISCQPCLLC